VAGGGLMPLNLLSLLPIFVNLNLIFI